MTAGDESQLKLQAAMSTELATRSKAEIVIELVVVLLVGLTGLCGNSIICLVINKTTSLRTISNYYIASLSFLDLLISLCTLMFVPEVTIKGKWTFSEAACQTQGFATAMLATASIYTMTLIAINRYFIMVKSNLHRRHFTKRNVFISIVVSWILGCNFPLSYLLQGNKFDFHPGKAICIFDVSKLNLTHAILTGFFNLQFPYIVISFCYFKIYLQVKRHKAQLRKRLETGLTRNTRISASDIRITKILFAIVLAFTFCWTPFFVIDLLGVFYGQFFAPRPVYVFYSIMAGSSAAVSPILYGALNRELRREITKLLKSVRCSFSWRTKVGLPVSSDIQEAKPKNEGIFQASEKHQSPNVQLEKLKSLTNK